MSGGPEFYVGYLPTMPEGLARRTRWIAIAVAGLSALVALVLIYMQQSFAPSAFEYGQYRSYQGTVLSWPSPMLISEGAPPYLLVGPGKHGVGDAVSSRSGEHVSLQGALIQRGADAMLEIQPHSVRSAPGAAVEAGRIERGTVTLRGEIVDSKCYLGVMNPGNGKVHRDCAARCISGGIPPGFAARDSSGELRYMLLVGADGGKLNRDILPVAGEPVVLTGELLEFGTLRVLRAWRIARAGETSSR
jgi:hypothetical protein